METLRVKDIVAVHERGIQPQYDPDGGIPVIKIANLRNGSIDFSDMEFIDEDYYKSIDISKRLKCNDIIICTTGKISLGKIDYYDYEREGVTTIDNYIIRLKKYYNPLFFIYFFRCVLGYFQFERDYTGATNQIHLYWEQISDFQIPNISLQDQKKIVNEIQKEVDQQKIIKKEIKKEANKIEAIIENTIR